MSGQDIAQLLVKAVPGASRDTIAGWLGDALKIRVRAPPDRGKANASIEKLIAEALGVPANKVRVVRGLTSPRKTVEVCGIAQHEMLARLPAQSGEPR